MRQPVLNPLCYYPYEYHTNKLTFFKYNLSNFKVIIIS